MLNCPIDKPGIFATIDDWEYILFTNLSKESFGQTSWTIKHMPVPDICKSLSKQYIYANRYYKWKSHIFLKDYDVVIYVDGFQIPNPENKNTWINLVNRVALSTNPPLIIADHYSPKKCAYLEMKLIVQAKKDTMENMKNLYYSFRSVNYPDDFGLFWNGCFIYRQHDQRPIPIWEELWTYMIKWTYRDQALYPFIMWKQKVDAKKLFYLADLDKIVTKTDSNHNHIYV
jgi:hypothetical protein